MNRNKNHNMIINTAIIVGYAGFILFLIGVLQEQNWIKMYDQTIYAWVKPLHPHSDFFFIPFTNLGNTLVMLLLTILGLVILSWRGHWRWGVFLTINSAIGALINHVVKQLVLRPRPTLPHLVPQGGYSFPSGHATAAIVFFGSLGVISHVLIHQRCWRHFWETLLIVFILLLGISRLYVQVHFPSDVTAGFLLAAANLLLHWQIAKQTYLRGASRPDDLSTD